MRLDAQFAALQNTPPEIWNFLHSRDPMIERMRKKLQQKGLAYNSQLAFGHVKIQPRRDFPESWKIVKCNNMIQYLLWDYNPPLGPHQPALRGQIFTIPPADARQRFDAIAADQQLDVK